MRSSRPRDRSWCGRQGLAGIGPQHPQDEVGVDLGDLLDPEATIRPEPGDDVFAQIDDRECGRGKLPEIELAELEPFAEYVFAYLQICSFHSPELCVPVNWQGMPETRMSIT